MSRYQIMLDPSGRAGCKGKCKQKLPKGSVRFGSITQSSSLDGEQAYWRCMGCMTTKVCQNAVEMHGGLASVPGYEALDASNQELVQSVFNHHVNGGEAPSLPPPVTAEETKASDKEEPKPKPKSPVKSKPKEQSEEAAKENDDSQQENDSSQAEAEETPSKKSKKKKAGDKPASPIKKVKKVKPTVATSRLANAAKAEERKAAAELASKEKADANTSSRAARAARIRA